MLLRRPAFAVLDEATSAIDQEVEAGLFQKLERCGTTFVTVTHRASLLRFHKNVLRIKGGSDGSERSWTIKPITAAAESDFPSPIRCVLRSSSPCSSC